MRTTEHRFKGGEEEFSLRVTTPADREQARAWNNADRWHRGVIAPEHWTEKRKGVDTYVLTDTEGELMYVRIERAVRVSIQFAPAGERSVRERIRRGLKFGLAFLSANLGAQGYGELIFDSSATLLRAFCMDSLGFRPMRDALVRRITIWEPKAASGEHAAGIDAASVPAPAPDLLRTAQQGVN